MGTRSVRPPTGQRGVKRFSRGGTNCSGLGRRGSNSPRSCIASRNRLEHHTRHAVDVEVMPQGRTTPGYILVPHGDGPFPAAVVVYYDPETSVGMSKETHGFGFQLANRGYVVLAIGTPGGRYWPNEKNVELQPLSILGYVAANCHTVLAGLPYVDAERIGIVGHSYGGKWAMFASCLYDKFACAVWSDPGIVFDENAAERQLLGALVSWLSIRHQTARGNDLSREPAHRRRIRP